MFATRWLVIAAAVFWAGSISRASGQAAGDDEAPAAEAPAAKAPAEKAPAVKSRMTTQELADWIDQRFAEEYQIAGLKAGEAVDDATFLRRVHLDLQGRVPTVAQIRDFLAESGSFKRQDMVDRLLIEAKQPERYAQRSADHLARVWRRMMIPPSSPRADMAGQLDPWLAKQFANNTPYDQIARKMLLVQPPQPMRGLLGGDVPAPPTGPADPDAAAGVFQQAIGVMPENLAGGYVRVFLGVRIHCAQCHDHPVVDWKRDDFWGIAALFGGAPAPGDAPLPAPTIKPEADKDIQFTAKLLWEDEPLKEIPAKKSPREVLADWLVSPDNKNFAATAVNRVWQYLCGRGLSGPVDELDLIDDPSERKVLDELAALFKESGHDIRWLIAGIAKSKVYQQRVVADSPREFPGFVHRPLKTLLPEQVFDSLEQALALPIAKADNGPRFNGERDQFVIRMNESTSDQPADFKGGIPQALMLMNGRLTADATNLETSRTLRAVVEAPFLPPAEKIEVLYLAALTRKPSTEEADFLLRHVQEQKTDAERKAAYAEIFWGLLNNPEFVLSR